MLSDFMKTNGCAQVFKHKIAVTNDCQESHHADTGVSFDLQIIIGMTFKTFFLFFSLKAPRPN